MVVTTKRIQKLCLGGNKKLEPSKHLMKIFIGLSFLAATQLGGVFFRSELLLLHLPFIIGFICIVMGIKRITKNGRPTFRAAVVLVTGVIYLVLPVSGVKTEIYKAEALLIPEYNQACKPSEGITVGKNEVRVCRHYNYGSNDYYDAVVSVTGPEAGDSVLKKIFRGTDISPSAQEKLVRYGTIWKNGFIFERLVGNYYYLKLDMQPR